MTYNRAEIMKRAWKLHRTGHYYSFGTALQQAWREAKKVAAQRQQGFVTTNELKVGDAIKVNGYGGYDDNNFTTTITGLREYDAQHLIVEFTLNGHTNNFVSQLDDMIQLVVSKSETAAA